MMRLQAYFPAMNSHGPRVIITAVLTLGPAPCVAAQPTAAPVLVRLLPPSAPVMEVSGWSPGDRFMVAASANDRRLVVPPEGRTVTITGHASTDASSAARITPGAWLASAVKQLPVVSEDTIRGQRSRVPSVTRSLSIADHRVPLVPRRPALCDFNAAPSAIVLEVMAP